MDLISTLGFVAGALTTFSFAPQVLKTYRTRRCDDLSWAMLIIFASGISLWLVYGFLVSSAPIVWANAVTLALVLVLGWMKRRYQEK